MSVIYCIFRWLAIFTCFPFQLALFTRKTYYEDGAPKRPWKKGGAVIISNHFNFLDYLMNMFVVLPRKLNVVASEFAFANVWIRFGVRFFGVIEANRITRNMRFMDKCAELIKKGQIVQIFPEGRNTPDGKIHEFKHSYLVIAYRANAPIIPIITDGNYGFSRRAHVIVGKPIYPEEYLEISDRHTPPREELTAANEAIYKRVLSLREKLEELKANDKNKKHKRKISE